jgi:hypothetical protein
MFLIAMSGLEGPAHMGPSLSVNNAADKPRTHAELRSEGLELCTSVGAFPNVENVGLRELCAAVPGSMSVSLALDAVVDVGQPGVESKVRRIAAEWRIAGMAGVEAVRSCFSGGETEG